MDQLLSARDAVAWFQVYKPADLVCKGNIDRTAVGLLAGPGGTFDPEHERMEFYFLRASCPRAAQHLRHSVWDCSLLE